MGLELEARSVRLAVSATSGKKIDGVSLGKPGSPRELSARTRLDVAAENFRTVMDDMKIAITGDRPVHVGMDGCVNPVGSAGCRWDGESNGAEIIGEAIVPRPHPNRARRKDALPVIVGDRDGSRVVIDRRWSSVRFEPVVLNGAILFRGIAMIREQMEIAADSRFPAVAPWTGRILIGGVLRGNIEARYRWLDGQTSFAAGDRPEAICNRDRINASIARLDVLELKRSSRSACNYVPVERPLIGEWGRTVGHYVEQSTLPLHPREVMRLRDD